MALPEKKPAKLWGWRAYDVDIRRTVASVSFADISPRDRCAMVLGGRDDATCRRLINKVGLTGKIFVTDDWEGYHRVIPEDQLFTGKDLTFPIEQDNSNVRHCLARFRHRTKVVSKCPSRRVRDAWWIYPCACCTTYKTLRATPAMPNAFRLPLVRILQDLTRGSARSASR